MNFTIRSLLPKDIPKVNHLAIEEDFAPGIDDVSIYRNTDRQGLWVGCLGKTPIGCIVGVRYNPMYAFLGLFIVEKKYRGNGYGLQLWKHAMNKLQDSVCIGLEAAPDRILDYSKWGFNVSSITTRWQAHSSNYHFNETPLLKQKSLSIHILEGGKVPPLVIQNYDSNKESTPRPHFISDWISHKSGNVIALLNNENQCLGFGRIRPCELISGRGWRIGPLIADSQQLAEILILNLLYQHQGPILIDSPGLNKNANNLFKSLGFTPKSKTVRMYRGIQPKISMDDVYGLASLELG